MLRRLAVLTIVALSVVSVAAQAPAGWNVRVDRSTSPSDPDNTPNLKFVTMGKGFHVTGGPAGVFWNPANTATGNYTASATFTLTKPSSHTNYYGLVFGGSELNAANQNYIYFTLGGNGSYLIKHRGGDANNQIHTIADWTPNAAIAKADATGKSTDKLEVLVGPQKIQYLINGKEVYSQDRAAAVGAGKMLSSTDGIAGIRVSHNLDVHIADFKVTAMK